MEQLCADALREYQKLFMADRSMDASHTLLTPSLILERSLFPLMDQPKPQHSYIGLIAMAILSAPERKMVLAEVYDWIISHYTYFRSRGSGWRNSIRHNLSLNDCFIKAGRASNGKGHYWAVHPACVRDFEKGDFRRRRAQRKVRRHMGLSVPEGESTDEESAPSTPSTLSHLLSPLVFFQQNSNQSLTSNPKRSFSIESLLANDVQNDNKCV